MTQIQDVNLEYQLYRILSGYYFIEINNTRYKVIYPTTDIKYRAEDLYHRMLDDHKFDTNWLSDLQLKILLDSNKIWTNQDEQMLSDQQKHLELHKIDLYKNYTNKDLKNSAKKYIASTNTTISQLISRKESMNYLTLKYFANNMKHEFIIMNCLLDENNNMIFSDLNFFNDNYNSSFAQLVSKEILDNQISINSLKNLARSDLWRSYYNEHNQSLINTNDDYRHLMTLTRMYDQIRQHPECPPDNIIEDDDALDGWFLYQKQKNTREKQKNQILDRVGGNKIKNSSEIFVMTQDTAEAKTIFGMNDEKSMKEIRATVQTAKEKGSVSWTSLEHVIHNKLVEEGKAGYKEINK